MGKLAITLGIFGFLMGCQSLQMSRTFRQYWRKQGSFSGWDSLAGGIGPLRACYDAKFYDVEVAVEPYSHFLIGSSRMEFEAVTEFDRMQVDLNRQLKVESVRLDGEELDYVRKKDIIYLKTPTIQPKARHSLQIYYEGKLSGTKEAPWKGGIVWEKDPQGLPWVGAVCEEKGSCLWWPNKAHPSDEPDSLKVSLLVPAGLQGISNGRLTEHAVVMDGRMERWNWSVTNPINLDNVSFYIGKFDMFAIPTPGADLHGDHVLCYVLPGSLPKAQPHFQQIQRIFQLLQRRFGPYPFAEDGFKIVHTPYVGMEHQSAIAYGDGFSNAGQFFTLDAFDYILLHETAHQWWGNSLTACDVAETWLHEGFATFTEAMYLEEYMGKHHYQSYLRYLSTGLENRYPLVGPKGVNYHSPWNSDIYGKGAWVLHSFRSALGQDSIFFGLLKQWAISNQKKIVCTEDFIQLANRVTGEDWNPFFQQYLYEAQPPLLEYFQQGDSLFFRWNEVPDGFRMPVRFIGENFGFRQTCSNTISWVILPEMKGLLPDENFALFRSKENPLLPLLTDLE